MYRKLILLMSFVLVLALASTNVVFGEVWEGRIKDSQDCVEQSNPTPTGPMDPGSSDLEFMNDGGIQTIGLRFVNVLVPAGATITKAYVVLTTEELEANAPVNIIIQGELTPNAPAFASTPGNISTRPKTTAVAKWSPEHWAIDNEPHPTSDISAVIEEIVSQTGWAAGNALVLIFNQDPDKPSQSLRTTHKAATPGYEPMLHIEYTLGSAAGPSPADGAIDVPRDVVLSWKAGVYAAATNGHKVYFSKNFNDVSAGIGGITQSTTSYAPPQRLDFSTTYYWRVDEVSGAPDYTVYQGNVWSFTTELLAYPVKNVTATASSQAANRGPENTVNGSGLDASGLLHGKVGDGNMWLSDIAGPQPTWIGFEFDKPYKLHEMWVWNSNDSLESMIGFGFKDVTVGYSANGIDYTILGTTHQFARAPGMPDYAHNTTIDFGGVSAKYVRLTVSNNWGGILPQYGLSEVRFFYIPVNATQPSPESGTTGVERSEVLGWRAGREAAKHDVYISADEQAVINGTAPVATVTVPSYSPPSLDLGVTYYWKVNEVNVAETPSTWESNIWSFTTNDHIIVDDFESYNDLDTTNPASNRIFNVWIDGYGTTTNGSIVGYENPPFAEQKIVHGGKQAMPFFYSNTAGKTYSEAERTFATPQNWTEARVQTLAVHFHGAAGNTGQLYLKINGSKVPYGGEASNLAQSGWQAWNIDLVSLGMNLQRVTKLAFGIDGNGAAGTLYFDDIGLYARSREFITPSAPDDTRLIGHWKFDGNAQDSSGKNNHGTAGGNPTFVAGKVGTNALNLDGSDYVAIDGVVNDITSTNITLSVWIKTTQSGEGNVFAANDSTSGYSLLFGVQGGNPYRWDGGDAQYPPAVNDDQWHLLTYVRNGATGYVYADGFLRASYPSSFSLGSVTRWSIGQEWDDSTPSDFYNGAVDDVRFYNYSLSEGEVGWLAGKTKPYDKPF